MAQNFKANLIALSAVLALPFDFEFNQRHWHTCIGAIAALHGIGGLSLNDAREPAHADVDDVPNDAIEHVFGEGAYHALFYNGSLNHFTLNEMHITLDRFIDLSYNKDVNAEPAPLSLNAEQLAQLFTSMIAASNAGFTVTELTLVNGEVKLKIEHKFS